VEKERKKEKKEERQGNGTHGNAQAVTKEYIVQVKYQGAQSWSLPTKIGGMMVVSEKVQLYHKHLFFFGRSTRPLPHVSFYVSNQRSNIHCPTTIMSWEFQNFY
jgi:hypothetical protein